MERPFSRNSEIALAEMDYVRHVERAGGLPFLLPMFSEEEEINDVILLMDGLLLTGGEDVHPRRYGQPILNGSCAISEPRDDFDFRFVPLFLRTGKPVLAICRGIQLINVLHGGTLLQDLPTQISMSHHSQMPPFDRSVHDVRISGRTRLQEIVGEDTLAVNSTHHQAVEHLGRGLRAVAQSEEGLVEALEGVDHPYLVAVQWHPERMADRDNRHRQLFEDFVNAARKSGMTPQ